MRGESRRARPKASVDLRHFGWDRALVATLRHPTLPWTEALDPAPLIECDDLGLRDKNLERFMLKVDPRALMRDAKPSIILEMHGPQAIAEAYAEIVDAGYSLFRLSDLSPITTCAQIEQRWAGHAEGEDLALLTGDQVLHTDLNPHPRTDPCRLGVAVTRL